MDPAPETGALRLDGLYIQRTEDSWNVIRFFADGVAVTAGVGTLNRRTAEVAEATRHICGWLLPDSEDRSKGPFQLDGDFLSFASTSPKGTVRYEGTLRPGGELLDLSWSSEINGAQGEGSWHFSPLIGSDAPTPETAECAAVSNGAERAAPSPDPKRPRPREAVLAESKRLFTPQFEGVLERYVGEEATILKAGDGDLYTVGAPNETFNGCAFVLTPTTLWALRGAGMFRGKKSASILLDQVEKVAITRLGTAGITSSDEVGLAFKTGARTRKGGPSTFTASLVARWQMKTRDYESWAKAITDALGR